MPHRVRIGGVVRLMVEKGMGIEREEYAPECSSDFCANRIIEDPIQFSAVISQELDLHTHRIFSCRVDRRNWNKVKHWAAPEPASRHLLGRILQRHVKGFITVRLMGRGRFSSSEELRQ